MDVAIMVTYHVAIVSLAAQPDDLTPTGGAQPPNICSHCSADFGRNT